MYVCMYVFMHVYVTRKAESKKINKQKTQNVIDKNLCPYRVKTEKRCLKSDTSINNDDYNLKR